MTKTILAKDLGKAHKTLGNYRVYSDKETGLYRIYFVCRGLVWSEMSLTYVVSKQLTATPVGYINHLENFESTCEELNAECRAMVLEENRAYAKVGA